MERYKLLKKVESNSLPIGNIVQLWEQCSLSSWWSIPTQRLVEHWYLELVNDEILVPDDIRFMDNSGVYWLEFWEKDQILYSLGDSWRVDSNRNWWRAPVKAKVVESNYKDLEPWDWFVYMTSINSKEWVVVWGNYDYYLKVSDSERVNIEWRWIVVTNWWTINMKVYKVVFIWY